MTTGDQRPDQLAPGLRLGDVGNVFLFAADLPAAVRWYTALLGREPDREAGRLVVWSLEHTRLTLHEEDEYNRSGPAGTGSIAYFDVDDVDAAARWCEAHGGVAHRGPKTVFSGERLLQVLDPFGNLLGLRRPPPT